MPSDRKLYADALAALKKEKRLRKYAEEHPEEILRARVEQAEAEGYARGVRETQQEDEFQKDYVAMRALMVVVDDGIISEGRAREIIGMTADDQRAFYRREHSETIAQAVQEEREACAVVATQNCDNRYCAKKYQGKGWCDLHDVAKAIRARGSS